MTFDQAMQLLGVLGGIGGSVLATRQGYRAVITRLANYVTVEEYRLKVTALHEQINALRERVTRLEERAAK